MIAVPGSIAAHRRFTAAVHALTTAEGGRHTPFQGNYRPQFYFRTTDVPGSIGLGDVTEVRPGDTVDVDVALGAAIAMSAGLGFTVREGGRTVAVGSVTAIVE